MARKSTIGSNPLDTVIPAAAKPISKAAPEPVAETKGKKERATFQLPAELIERARNAVYWTPGATMAGIMEDALEAHLDRLEKKRGEAFPQREGALKTGRPVK